MIIFSEDSEDTVLLLHSLLFTLVSQTEPTGSGE